MLLYMGTQAASTGSSAPQEFRIRNRQRQNLEAKNRIRLIPTGAQAPGGFQ
jgi:hypothetical protein